MAESEKSAKSKPPKGGRKGGTTFPRIALKQALDYSDKLVSKTHTGALPEKTILAGVFGNSGALGKVRVSALKQFGLLDGEASAYQASELAKAIDAAVEEERVPLLQKAFLSSKLFKEMFTTYNGDTVAKGKLRQHALSLKVHPDSAEECVELFLASAETAQLGTRDGDSITLVKSGEAAANAVEQVDLDEPEVEQHAAKTPEQQGVPPKSNVEAAQVRQEDSGPRQKSGLNVTLTVDSSSDPDKLQKQLELLRKFGVI
jgi:hypothetical protein